MYPLAILMLFSAIVMSMLLQTHQKMQLIQQHRAALDAMYLVVATEAFQARLVRTGSLGTTTLDDVANSDEGFKVRGVDANRLFLASASNLSDGTWYFDRLLLYAVGRDSLHLADPAEIARAENNRCNPAQGLDSAAIWCGPESGVAYTLIETRKIYNALLTEEAMRMEGSLHKLARGFKNKFPMGPLTAGGSQALCSLGGNASGSAGCALAQCSGTRTIDKVPLDCTDLYSNWGNPAVLNVVTSKHIVLASSASNVRVSASGTTRKIARELRVP